MRLIDTGQIVDPTSQQPFTGKSLDFLQQSMTEITAAMAYALIGANYSASTVYVLSGCTISANVIGNGYVFYNGSVYTMIGADTTAYVNVPVLDLQLSYDLTIDPVMFSDGVNKYIHEINLMYIRDAVSGTGEADYADVVFVNSNKKDITVLTPASHSNNPATNPGAYLAVSGSTFTGPNREFNVKVTFECDVRVPKVTDGKIGFGTNVTNLTLASNYATDRSLADNWAFSGTTRTYPFIATRYITGLAAGTQLGIRTQNSQTDPAVAENIVLTYELY